jgi:hypothetical protein
MSEVQPPAREPAFAGSSGTVRPWSWARENAPCTLLLVATGAALAARLVLPEQLSTHAGRWAIYVVCLQAAFGGFWEFVEGFVWQRRPSYVRGTALVVAATTLYALAGESAPS